MPASPALGKERRRTRDPAAETSRGRLEHEHLPREG